MTEVTIFGEPTTKKPIEFCLVLGKSSSWSPSTLPPSYYKQVTLLERNYTTKGYDLILASSSSRVLYLGHWNDGIV